MKLRHLLTGTILTISILAASAVTAFAAVSKDVLRQLTAPPSADGHTTAIPLMTH